MEDILLEMAKAKQELSNASTRGAELDAWAKWCKLFDKREALEASNRDSAKSYAL